MDRSMLLIISSTPGAKRRIVDVDADIVVEIVDADIVVETVVVGIVDVLGRGGSRPSKGRWSRREERDDGGG